MAAPTTVQVTVDLDEYSKFERPRQVINVQWTASGGGNMSGTVLTVQLVKARRDRSVAVYSKDVTISGTTDPQVGVVSINLYEDVVDQYQINLIRRGYYFVKAFVKSNPSVAGVTADFLISILTAQQLRDTYIFGLPLEANDVRAVKFQPSEITGVEVVQVSTSHATGFEKLTYVYHGTATVSRQISWGAGPLIVINSPGRYLLKRDCQGSDYIVIQVRNVTALPTANKAEELFVTAAEITDDMLRRWINQSCDWLENDKLAGVFLEPTRITTDLVPVPGGPVVDWDFLVPPITFFPSTPARWIDIMFPYPGLLRLDNLFGQIANTRIIDTALEWLEIAERSGYSQLVPFNQQIAFQFIGLVWVESIRGQIELPNFWHFNGRAGLRQVDPVLLEILGKKAAIDALTVAGHAYRGGFSSQSLSRDGVSESVSYTASAVYGIYAATIEDYNKFINREIKGVKGRYKGLGVVVL